jgi:hypothetical protein
MLRIEYIAPQEIVAAGYNPRTIAPENRARLLEGIKEFGFVEPIVVRREDRMVIGGHQRLDLAVQEEMDSIPVVFLDGIDDMRAKALNVLLNNPNAQGRFDNEALAALMAELDAVELARFTGFPDSDIASLLAGDFSMPVVDDGIGSVNGGTPSEAALGGNYSREMRSPVYTPKEARPPALAQLFDRSRTDALLDAIERADGLPDDVADFLRNAAERHTVFRFDRIAEYYAHAPPKLQALMEDSALVIIDFNRAVELGYVKLTERMLEQAGYRAPEDEESDEEDEEDVNA